MGGGGGAGFMGGEGGWRPTIACPFGRVAKAHRHNAIVGFAASTTKTGQRMAQADHDFLKLPQNQGILSQVFVTTAEASEYPEHSPTHVQRMSGACPAHVQRMSSARLAHVWRMSADR